MFYQALIVADSPVAHVVDMLVFPSHWHSEIEILYCLEGSFTAIVDGKTFKVSKGQTLFVGSVESHEYTEFTPGTKCLLIEIGAGLLKNEFGELSSRVFAQPVLEDTPDKVRFLFDKIILESKQPETPGGEWIVKSCLFELAAFMLRGISGASNPSSQKHERMLAIQRVDMILEYLQQNYRENITVEYASKMTGYNKSNFCKLFKKATQLTFHQYLNMIRVNKACLLLGNENDSVETVGEKIGFPETKTFCRVFKELMNATPGEYRKKHRGK